MTTVLADTRPVRCSQCHHEVLPAPTQRLGGFGSRYESMFEHADFESELTLKQALSMVPEQRGQGRERTADHVFSLQLPKTKFSFTFLRRSGLIPHSKKRSSLPSTKSKWRPFRPVRPPRDLCPPVPTQMSISEDILLSKLGPEGNLSLAEVLQHFRRGTKREDEQQYAKLHEINQEPAYRHREKAYKMLTSDDISGMSSVDNRSESDYPPSRIANLSPRQQALSSSFSTLPDTASKLDLRPPPLRMALSQRPAYIPPPFPSRATSPPPIPPRSRLRPPPNGMTDTSSSPSSKTSPASSCNSLSVYSEHDSELLPVDLTPPSSPLSVESASGARDKKVSHRSHPYNRTENDPFLSSLTEGKPAAEPVLLEKMYSPQTKEQFDNVNLSTTEQEMTKAQQRPSSAKYQLCESDVKAGMEGLNRWIDETTALMRDASRSSSSTSHQVFSPTFERDTVSSSRTLVPSSNRLDHVRVVSQVEEHQKPYAKPEVGNMTALEGGLSPSESRPVTRLRERSSAVSSTTSLSSYEAMPTDLQRVEMIINGRVYPTLVAPDGRLWEIPWCVTNNT